MRDIFVSICCAAYNQARYIDRAIESFLLQKTSFEFEIIVHDDASSDGTAEAVLRWQARYPARIHAIVQSENQYSRGVSIPDVMLAKARGKYIATCEGDDYWTSPDKLEKQVRYMEANPDCALCVHASWLVNPEGKPKGMLKQFRRDCDVDMRDILLFGGRLAATSSYLYPAALRKGGLPAFCALTPGVGDNALQLFLATKGKVHYFSEPLSCYRRGHPGSWTMRTYRSGEAARIPHLKASIALYGAFDAYTGGRWKSAVQNVIVQKEMEVLQAEHAFSALFRPPYREAYRALRLRRRVKILMKFLLCRTAPKLYARLLGRG